MNAYDGLKIAIAVVIPAFLVWLTTSLRYWSGYDTTVYQYSAYLLGLSIGIYTLLSLRVFSLLILRIIVSLYAPILLVALFWVGLFTACSHGDCL